MLQKKNKHINNIIHYSDELLLASQTDHQYDIDPINYNGLNTCIS